MPNNFDALDTGQDSLQQLNPDLYNRIKPHIDEIVKELNKQELTDSTFDAAVDEIMRSLEPDDMQMQSMPAISNIYPRENMYPRGNIRFRQNRYPIRRRPGYERGLSTEDLIRLLLLRELGYIWF